MLSRSPAHGPTLPAWLLIGLLAVCLPPLLGPSLPALAAVAPPRAVGGVTRAGLTGNLGLTITPGTWSMLVGDSASFGTTLVTLPADCDVVALTVDWSLVGTAVFDGVLNASVGPSATFTATAPTGGLAILRATASVALLCAGTGTGDVLIADAPIAITPAVLATSLTVDPNPATPGTRVVLAWQVEGGVPPFDVGVAFGDGTFANFTEGGDGAPFVAHHFAVAGRYSPTVTVLDAQGHRTTTGIADPLDVASGLSAAIEAPSPTLDRGVRVTFNLSISGGLPPYLVTWNDGTGVFVTGPNWTLAPPDLGNLSLSADVLDSLGNGYLAHRTLAIVAGPLVNVSAVTPREDVGVPFDLRADVGGGVAPYALAWSVAPGGSNGSASVPSASGLDLLASVPSPGTVWATATVRDAEGVTASVTLAVGEAAPRPSFVATASAAAADAGTTVTFTAGWSGGVLPVAWTAVASLPLLNSSADSGRIATATPIPWAGSFGSAGNATVTFLATDSAGLTLVANVSLRVYPALIATLSVATDSVPVGGDLPVAGSVAGGVPPFTYAFTISGSAASSGNLSSAAPVTALLGPPAAGYAIVAFQVRDALGNVAVERSTVLVTPATNGSSPPAPPAPAPETSWSAWPIGVATIAGAAGLLLWPRIRRRRSRTAGPGAMGVVRRLLRDGEPMDRETVTFLAEEEGAERPAVEAAIDRWVRAGRIRIDGEGTGEEFLEWVERSPPASTRTSEAP